MIEPFISIFVIYFVVIDPIGMVPLFVALTGGLTTRAKLRMAIEGPFIAGIILVFFAIFGAQLLTYLGISLIAFKIGGAYFCFRSRLKCCRPNACNENKRRSLMRHKGTEQTNQMRFNRIKR